VAEFGLEPTLWGLFIGSFLAATLLPGGSEIILFALLKSDPQILWPALGMATVGNTLGGLSSYGIGRLLPQRGEMKGLPWIRRYGSFALLFAWAPIIGDALCVAAGWARVNWLPATFFMMLGKFFRYWVVAYAATF